MTPTRFKVVKRYLSHRNNVSFGELMEYFFAPSYKSIARGHISRIEESGDYDQIYFKGFQRPLYYPKGLKEHSLHQVIVESFNKKNWHYYEIPQTTVTVNDIVVDCGSAEGLFAFLVQNRCKKIYLIEPLSKFVSGLRKTFEHAENVEIFPLAVSDKEYSTGISNNDISSALTDNGGGESVEVTTLDKIFFEKGLPVSYLKLDLEGYDYKALIGGKELIRKYKPKIAVTTYHEKRHEEEIRKYLLSIVPEYIILSKGIYQETGSPVMLHAWI